MPSQKSAPTVLVVDDDPGVRLAIAGAFLSEGFQVLTAGRARMVVNLFGKILPDVVLLDLGLPDGNGWDLFESLSRQAPQIPIVIITARAGQAKLAREACVAALVEKPVDMEVLIELVRQVIEEHEHDRLSRLTHGEPRTLVVPSGSRELPGRS